MKLSIVLLVAIVGIARGEPPVEKGAPPASPAPLELQPYRISAHLALFPEARIDAEGRERLLAAWRGLIRRFVGAPWDLTIAGDDDGKGDGGAAASAVDLDSLETGPLAPLARDFDKLWLIQVRRDAEAFWLVGRELDVGTGRLGPTNRRPVPVTEELPRALLNLAHDLFRPTATLGEQSGGGVVLTVRGASLRAASPVGQVVLAGTIFRPIRLVTLPGGERRVLDIPFTYLRVDSLDGPVAHCAIHSALRDPLTRRIAQKSTFTALGSKPGPAPTRLRFLTHPDKAPAAGYRLTARPLPDGVPREIGTTDREGRIVLPPNATEGLVALRLLAGSVEPVAEFPLMPGETSRERTLPPFDPRLATVTLETQLDSLRDAVIDLVANRSRLEARLKARVEGEDWAGAEAILKEVGRLPTRDSFASQLTRLKDDAAAQQARTRTAVLTKTAQAQVAELEGLIARYLDDEVFRSLSEAMAAARSKPTPKTIAKPARP